MSVGVLGTASLGSQLASSTANIARTKPFFVTGLRHCGVVSEAFSETGHGDANGIAVVVVVLEVI